jgi:hypothetical protein
MWKRVAYFTGYAELSSAFAFAGIRMAIKMPKPGDLAMLNK